MFRSTGSDGMRRPCSMSDWCDAETPTRRAISRSVRPARSRSRRIVSPSEIPLGILPPGMWSKITFQTESVNAGIGAKQTCRHDLFPISTPGAGEIVASQVVRRGVSVETGNRHP